MLWKKQNKHHPEMVEFMKRMILKIESNTLTRTETNALIRFFASCMSDQMHPSQDEFDEKNIRDYLFLGWWVSKFLNQS